MLDTLTGRLTRIVKTIRGEARLTQANVQDALREVRIALLEADCALPVVKDFIAAVREKALGAEVIGSLTPGQALVGVVHRELTRLMGEANVALDLATQPPAVFLMAGLQGSGKTTTTGKLARWLIEQRKRVLLVSCDVYRPAAIEQLKTVAAQAGAEFLPTDAGEAPAAIARRALEYARTRYFDVLIVDTARHEGRREVAQRVGAAGYLVHPVDVRRIEQRIEHLVGARPVAQRAGEVLAETRFGLGIDLGDDRDQVPGADIEILPRLLEKFEVRDDGIRAGSYQVIQCITHGYLRFGKSKVATRQYE